MTMITDSLTCFIDDSSAYPIACVILVPSLSIELVD
jgi:hypothetical protein